MNRYTTSFGAVQKKEMQEDRRAFSWHSQRGSLCKLNTTTHQHNLKPAPLSQFSSHTQPPLAHRQLFVELRVVPLQVFVSLLGLLGLLFQSALHVLKVEALYLKGVLKLEHMHRGLACVRCSCGRKTKLRKAAQHSKVDNLYVYEVN